MKKVLLLLPMWFLAWLWAMCIIDKYIGLGEYPFPIVPIVFSSIIILFVVSVFIVFYIFEKKN